MRGGWDGRSREREAHGQANCTLRSGGMGKSGRAPAAQQHCRLPGHQLAPPAHPVIRQSHVSIAQALLVQQGKDGCQQHL